MFIHIIFIMCSLCDPYCCVVSCAVTGCFVCCDLLYYHCHRVKPTWSQINNNNNNNNKKLANEKVLSAVQSLKRNLHWQYMCVYICIFVPWNSKAISAVYVSPVLHCIYVFLHVYVRTARMLSRVMVSVTNNNGFYIWCLDLLTLPYNYSWL
jgi:hypothetical protein